MTEKDDWVRNLVRNWREAELEGPDRALLEYADKLTREPWAVRREDVEALRSHGFGERAILDACQIAAYYAFANRLADGLGVELEEYWKDEVFDPLS